MYKYIAAGPLIYYYYHCHAVLKNDANVITMLLYYVIIL